MQKKSENGTFMYKVNEIIRGNADLNFPLADPF